jgi:dethiobiotin synthetase
MTHPIPNSYFITGTDTDVGKTVITALLALQALQAGASVCVYKPVQTGAVDLTQPDDPACISQWIHGWLRQTDPLPQAQFRVFNRYVYPAPCAPWVAQRQPNASDLAPIQWPVLLDDFDSLQRQYDVLLVEGAGGLRVPLVTCDQSGRLLDTVDLIQALGLPVVLVARPTLGTLNHTVLAWDVLQHASVDCQRVYVSGLNPHSPDVAEATVLETLARYRPALAQRLCGVPWFNPSLGPVPLP